MQPTTRQQAARAESIAVSRAADPGPSRRSGRDPLALGVLAVVVLALVSGIALGVRELVSGSPQAPARGGPAAGQGLAARLDAAFSALVAGFRDEPAPAPNPPAKAAPSAPRPTPKSPDARAPLAAFPAVPAPDYAAEATALPPGGRWSYRVGTGAAQSPAGLLNYEVVRAGDQAGPRLRLQWAPNGGSATTWEFGVFAAGHASHANVRFPGFFMHPAYMPHPLQAGQRFTWAFPWQGGEAGARRERRFTATVAGWESVTVPAGQFDAARIEAVLKYLADGKVQAEVRNTLWYAPAARQLVRVQWSGKSPDEGHTDIVAELASLHLR